MPDLDGLARQSNNALDERLCVVQGIPEDYYVIALDPLKVVHKLIDEDPFLMASALFIACHRQRCDQLDYWSFPSVNSAEDAVK